MDKITFKLRGIEGSIDYNEKSGTWKGVLLEVDTYFPFEGETLEDLYFDFEDAVETYFNSKL